MDGYQNNAQNDAKDVFRQVGRLIVYSILYIVFCMTEKIRSFKDLNAWKEGHKLVLAVYEITKTFLDKEFSLVNQMRRSAVSITSNIAEGFSRNTVKDKYQFYSVAHGSLTELQSQLTIAADLGYLSKEKSDTVNEQTIVVAKLIQGLKRIRYSIQNTKY